MADKWVTGKALRTVIALRGIQVGDTIRFKRCRRVAHGHQDDEEMVRKGWTVTKVEYDEPDYYPLKIDATHAHRAFAYPKAYPVCLCAVTGWKPKKEKADG